MEHFYDVHRCLIDPRDPNSIFVTGGAGVYVTKTGGSSWERWTSPEWAADVYPDGFTWNPKNPDLMFVAAAEHNPATWRKAGEAAPRRGKDLPQPRRRQKLAKARRWTSGKFEA